MDDYIYYKLQHKEYKEVELVGCIDLDTIDDDEPDVEYLQNDGLWGRYPSDYCKINGEDFTVEFDKLKETEHMEWGIIAQILADCGDIAMELVDDSDITFKREFESCNLYVAYNRDFDHPKMYVLPLGEIVSSDLE